MLRPFKNPNHILFQDSVVIMKGMISWLFKFPILTIALLKFDHTQSNSKKWTKNNKFLQMWFFAKKLIKFSCSSWPLLLYKIKKEDLTADSKSYGDEPFLDKNDKNYLE